MATFRFKDIRLEYVPGNEILTNASLQVENGNITLLEGDNGVGKTSLLKLLGGLIPDKSGNGSIENFQKNNPRKFYYFPEDMLFPDFTVLEYLWLTDTETTIRFGSQYYQFQRVVESLLTEFRIEASPFTIIRELSTGNRTLLKFASLMLDAYHVLLLDEPTSHLDEEKLTVIVSKTTEYIKRNASYCIISTHDSRLMSHNSIAKNAKRYRIDNKVIKKVGNESH